MHGIITTTLWNRHSCHHPDFITKETKIQRSLIVSLPPHRGCMIEPEFKSSYNGLQNLRSLTDSEWFHSKVTSQPGLFLLPLFPPLAVGSWVVVGDGIKCAFCVLFLPALQPVKESKCSINEAAIIVETTVVVAWMYLPRLLQVLYVYWLVWFWSVLFNRVN